jgi:hypothetical protein
VDPQSYQDMQFGGGVSQSIVSPVALLVVLIAGVMICVSSRRNALLAFLVAGILIPMDQVLLIGPLHFPMLRVLIIFAAIRMFRSRTAPGFEIFSGGMNGIDKALVVLTVVTMVDGIVLWRQFGEVIYQLGNMYTTFGVYFFLRFLIRDADDVKQTLRSFAWIAGVAAAIMIGEQVTGRNILYMVLGGARASEFTSVISRDDHLRANACFGHPILAGTFGGILLPLFVGLWGKEKKERKYAAVGIAASTVMAFAAASSTALAGFLGGLLALCLWPLRRSMRILRWGVAITLVSLHMVMKAPVWQLVSRIDLTGSSSGYHRYQLIDQCIRHFGEWAFVGTKDFGSWGWDMWDLSNQYVAAADTTGLIPLLALLAMIVFGFKYVGRARRIFSRDRKQEFFMWGLGASLFANVIAFFGISYFDQTIIAWYALLAMICAMAVVARKARDQKSENKKKEETPEQTYDSGPDSVDLHVPVAPYSTHKISVRQTIDHGIREMRFSQGSSR